MEPPAVHGRETAASAVRGRTAGARIGVAVALALLPPGTAAAYAATPHPAKPKKDYALRIGIDNGLAGVGPGDRVTYTIKVTNTGNADTPPLLLTQTLIPGVRLVSSAPKGKVTGGRVTWSGKVPAGGTGRYSATVQVGALPAGTQRLAAVACATTKGSRRPIVCAADSDRLPAPAAGGRPGSSTALWYGAGGAVAALTALMGVLLRRVALRRREWTARR
ncbi:hypothetical protein [Sphaerisporangium rhizosphaerae]|uniref:DUF11 domain-containing protein n=1 Tax=Sphaerisporangium rhizosphaerae TaxID=2269375 RepID=A0ABW2NYE8_9ACTN